MAAFSGRIRRASSRTSRVTPAMRKQLLGIDEASRLGAPS